MLDENKKSQNFSLPDVKKIIYFYVLTKYLSVCIQMYYLVNGYRFTQKIDVTKIKKKKNCKANFGGIVTKLRKNQL